MELTSPNVLSLLAFIGWCVLTLALWCLLGFIAWRILLRVGARLENRRARREGQERLTTRD